MKVKIIVPKGYTPEQRGNPEVPEWCMNKRCHIGLKCQESESVWACGYDRRFFAARLDTAMNPAKCGEYDSSIGKKEGEING